MKRKIIGLLILPLLVSCSMEVFNIKTDLNNRIGVIEIHRCFCGPSAYRYLIVTQDSNEPKRFNPVNLPEDFKDDNYNIEFSASLLSDSSIIYTNTPTDAVVEDFRVRNIKLTSIRKFSTLRLNDTIDLAYGKTYRNFERNISIRLDSVTEDSRCPYQVECVWAGNAQVRFNFALNNAMTPFSLNTLSSFKTDTLISGYTIQLLELKPYPMQLIPIVQQDYIARIKITR